MGRSDLDAEAQRTTRAPGAEVVDRRPQRVGRNLRRREALAQAVGVDGDEAALEVGQRPARRSARQRSGVLEGQGDRAATRASERAGRLAHGAERDPHAGTVASRRDHEGPEAGSAIGPLEGRGVTRVDVEDHEVVARIGPDHLGLLDASVVERDLHGAITQVVGVGEDLAGCDDNTGAAVVAPHRHGRRSDQGGGVGELCFEFGDQGHDGHPSEIGD